MTDLIYSNEFRVDCDLNGEGILLITDIDQLLFAELGLPPENLCWLLNLGDTGNQDDWHITTSWSCEDAVIYLDQFFSAYVRYYCHGKIWVDAEVNFIDARTGAHVCMKEYGFDDGSETLTFNVYCNTGDNPHNWARVLQHFIGLPGSYPTDVQQDKLEQTMSIVSPTPGKKYSQRYIIARPDNSLDDNISVRGFQVAYG